MLEENKQPWQKQEQNKQDTQEQDEHSLSGFSAGAFTSLMYGNPDLMVQPFSRNIFLLKTNAAGCHHIDNIEKYLSELETGRRLILLREPDNPYDKRAIMILDGDRKLGYIPRRQNDILSRLMDAGKYLYATADDKLTDPADSEFTYAALTISIYMQD